MVGVKLWGNFGCGTFWRNDKPQVAQNSLIWRESARSPGGVVG